ncbi:Pre-mRNA-splicing factor 38A [Trichinella nelsoni]|uniref:Pre-mRNA-splicing factor 38A n=1 Tax=Trichinella nelsoni TaxID=6336 RepID=A0A0V0S2G5_9BILA|nr:Pre-mRNA-splicing factor 38A [Trichinella nelsoni]
MANRTVKDAASLKGTNPQYLIEKVTRSRIYDSRYWKEECFALSAELLVDRGMELRFVGGVYGGNIKPTPFLCLLLKMLQIQPEKDIVIEFIRQEDSKYIRALGALYLRMTFSYVEVYKYLEPLLNDYRKLRWINKQGKFELIHMDEFVDKLLREERFCDVQLPRLQKRAFLEETNQLPQRVSIIEEELESFSSESEEEIQEKVKVVVQEAVDMREEEAMNDVVHDLPHVIESTVVVKVRKESQGRTGAGNVIVTVDGDPRLELSMNKGFVCAEDRGSNRDSKKKSSKDTSKSKKNSKAVAKESSAEREIRESNELRAKLGLDPLKLYGGRFKFTKRMIFLQCSCISLGCWNSSYCCPVVISDHCSEVVFNDHCSQVEFSDYCSQVVFRDHCFGDRFIKIDFQVFSCRICGWTIDCLGFARVPVSESRCLLSWIVEGCTVESDEVTKSGRVFHKPWSEINENRELNVREIVFTSFGVGIYKMLMFKPDDLVQKKLDMDFNPIHMKLYSGIICYPFCHAVWNEQCAIERVACRVGVSPGLFVVENSVAVLSKMEPSVVAALVACSGREQCNQAEHKQVAHLRRSDRNALPIRLVEKVLTDVQAAFKHIDAFYRTEAVEVVKAIVHLTDRCMATVFLMARKYSGQSIENRQSAQKYICTMAIWQ